MGNPRYRRARELAGMSVAQAARAVGVPDLVLISLEVNMSDPAVVARAGIPPVASPVGVDVLEKAMAAVYACSLSWMRGGEPQIPERVTQVLRDHDLPFAARDALLEAIGSLPRPGEERRRG